MFRGAACECSAFFVRLPFAAVGAPFFVSLFVYPPSFNRNYNTYLVFLIYFQYICS